MSQDINTVTLIGRLTRDAELKYLSSGTAKSEFSIAVNKRVKKGDEWTDVASFFNLTLWAKQAEGLNKYLVKGTQVAIRGSLEQNRWEKDGQKHSEVRISIEDIQLLGGGQREGSAPAPREGKPAPARGQDFDPSQYEDSIPF
jgi:single-strand DNA-binding protein